MKMLLMACVATAANLWMEPADAAPKSDPWPTLEIRYGDLDLTKVGDQVRLKYRLTWAASVLCKDLNSAAPVPPVEPICYRMTTQNALQKMDKAIAQAKGGPALAAATPR